MRKFKKAMSVVVTMALLFNVVPVMQTITTKAASAVVEAENTTIVDPTGCGYIAHVNQSWATAFSGKGYVEKLRVDTSSYSEFSEAVAADAAPYMHFNYNAETAGRYKVTMKFSSTGNARSYIYYGATELGKNVTEVTWKPVVTKTSGNWTTFYTVNLYVDCVEGDNTIYISGVTNYEAANDNNVMYDSFTIEKAYHSECEEATVCKVLGVDTDVSTKIAKHSRTWNGGAFSNCAYVEGLNQNLSGQPINDDGSNVSYIGIPINVDKDGTYKLSTAVAGGTSIAFYGKANDDSKWQAITAAGTGDWTGVVAANTINVNLKAGSNMIYLTGDTKGGWMELDYIDAEYLGDIPTETTTNQNETTEEPTTAAPIAAIGRHEAENTNYGTGTLQTGSYYTGMSNGSAVGINPVWTSAEIKYISQTVFAEKAGKYILTVAYATPVKIELMAKIGEAEWQLFDQSDVNTKVLPATPDWNVASTATTTVTLNEGENTIYISGPLVDWNANWQQIYGGVWSNTSAANIDYFELAEYVEPETTTPTLPTYTVKVDGNVVATVEEGDTYTLGNAEYGYYYNGQMFPAGYEYTVEGNVEFTSVNTMSVTMEYGAGIRTAAPAGLRFQATILSDNMDAVKNQDAIKEGMLVTANDIFVNNNSVLDLNSKYTKIVVGNSGWYNDVAGSYCGSVVNIIESNYIRNFVARAYVTISYVDGTSKTIYSGMSEIRSISYVAKAIKSAGYPNLTTQQIEIINSYIR